MIIGSFWINRHLVTGNTPHNMINYLKISNVSPPIFLKQHRINNRLMNTTNTVLEAAKSIKESSIPRKKASIKATGANKEPPEVIGNPKYNSLKMYLEYAKTSKVSTSSTVFQGNLYELSFLEFLRSHFELSRIIHQGGRDDKGIDIRAIWDMTDLNPSKSANLRKSEDGKVFETVNSTKKVKPLVLKKDLKKSLNVKLYVQCKCWEKSRVDARMIREINGTFFNGNNERLLSNSHDSSTSPSSSSSSSLTTNDRKKRARSPTTQAFLMIVAPTGFTRQGLIDFDKSLMPLIFVRFSKNRMLAGVSKSEEYNPESYETAKFESVYCNPMAQALMKGLDWVTFIQNITTVQGNTLVEE